MKAESNTGGSTSAELSYNIASMRLQGVVDGFEVSVIAYSGGRGGSKTPGASNSIIVNNPFLTGLKLNVAKKNEGSVGGALPMGIYSLSLHENKKNWIRLNPVNVVNMKGRDGFAIHGRGERGSDGCIVPSDFEVVKKLCELLAERKKKSQGSVYLKVYAVGDLDFFLNNMESWKNTA